MRFLRCVVALGAITLGVQGAWAQAMSDANYRPMQPTFSPWLNLYQHNSGVLDNYHTFVRPQMQLQETLRHQHSMIQEQGEGIQELSGQMNTAQQGHNPAHPTGAGAVFMDYSHYYDVKGPANRTRGALPRTAARASRGAY